MFNSIDCILDPLQMCTLSAIMREIDYICSKVVKIEREQPGQNPIQQISKQIIEDFTEDHNKDENFNAIINEIRSGVDLNELLSSTTSSPEIKENRELEFSADLSIKIISVAVIHDHTNSNRNYDRVFNAFYQMDSQTQ
mmetsp:Transcript_1672/g.2083  ORF Transcript_1672/g.2083 Transcript_1672/m.2083 type:complete len:139 (+) Transcript_1672:924-1340(+)